MLGSYLERRAFLLGGLRAAAASTAASFWVAESAAQEQSFDPAFRPLDEFIRQYMRAMNSPGLTLALANTNGSVRTATFGFSDLEARKSLTPDLLFEIGSISKSFAALTLLQLGEEGKLDLQRPILEYLPWLPIEASYGVITVHHLLTHTFGASQRSGSAPYGSAGTPQAGFQAWRALSLLQCWVHDSRLSDRKARCAALAGGDTEPHL
jgi:CubicO group peptidase (beta-lactamase class C family)